MAAVAALVGIAAAAAAGFRLVPEDPNEQLALRLHDLPPGYIPVHTGPEGTEADFLCEGIHPSDASRKLASYLRRFHPAGCLGGYVRAYRVPGPGPTPSLAGTGVLRAKTENGAGAGFAIAGELLAEVVEEREDLEEVTPQATVGDATRLFHWRHIPKTRFSNYRFGSFLVWRSGRVISAIFADAASFADSDRIALELAQRQQAHVESPTPYTEAERDFSEVGLDDPATTFPVRWLGHDFAPGHGLPPAQLREGAAAPLGSFRDGVKLLLQYSNDIELEGWTKAGWKRFLETRDAGYLLGAEDCAKPVSMPLAEGRATIFTSPVVGWASCRHAPKRRYAIVHVGGTVIAVNFSGCPDCVSRNPYNSLKGMKAIVRGLKLRPQPVY